MTFTFRKVRLLTQALVLVISVPFISTETAHAANFTFAAMRWDRMMVNVANPQILVVVKPVTVGTETQIRVDFDTAFTVAACGSITATTTGIPTKFPNTYNSTALTAVPTLGSPASSCSTTNPKYAIFTSGDLTVGTQYGFYITAGITNPAGAGQYLNTITTQTSVPATIDSSQVGVRIITNDQVVVSAVVPPTFGFVLGGNTDSFTANLDPTAIKVTTGVTVQVTTNAAKGWVAWVKSTGGLTSATTSQTISSTGSVDGTPATVVIGTKQYVMWVALTTQGTGLGTVTIDPEYAGSATSGGTLNTSFQSIASSSGTTNGDTITLKEVAAIDGVTPAAADYQDTLTIIGAGLF